MTPRLGEAGVVRRVGCLWSPVRIGRTKCDEIAAKPNPDAQCGTGAGSGAFGYLGKGSSLAGGADGYQTGLNNSAVCGNRP